MNDRNSKQIYNKDGVMLITSYSDFVNCIKLSNSEYAHDKSAEHAKQRLGATCQADREQYNAWLNKMRKQFSNQHPCYDLDR